MSFSLLYPMIVFQCICPPCVVHVYNLCSTPEQPCSAIIQVMDENSRLCLGITPLSSLLRIWSTGGQKFLEPKTITLLVIYWQRASTTERNQLQRACHEHRAAKVISWCIIIISCFCYRKQMKRQDVDEKRLPYNNSVRPVQPEHPDTARYFISTHSNAYLLWH